MTAFVTAALLIWGLTAPPAAADTASAVTAGISAQTPRSVDASPAAADPQGRDEQVIVVEGVDASATPAPTAAEHELAALTGPISTIDFVASGIMWDVDEQNPVLEASMRVREGGQWSTWTSLEVHPEPRGEGTLRTGTEPLVTTGADGVQISVTTATGRAPRNLEVALIDPGTAPTDRTVAEAPAVEGPAGADSTSDSSRAQTAGPVPTDDPELVDQLLRPAIVTRAQWGAEESWATDSQSSTELQAMYVHHTAGTNDYSPEQAVQQLRAIYHYHTRSLQWGDIGYHFLVDRFGTVYEGRRGAMDRLVLGAQAGGFNTNTIGVSAMGNYELVDTPAVMVQALNDVLAWQAARHGLDVTQSTTLVSRASSGSTAKYPYGTEVTVPVLLGHRDTNATLCPGRYLAAQLPSMRATVAEKVEDAIGTLAPEPGAPSLPDAPHQVLGDGRGVRVAWNAVPGASGYQIMYREQPHGGDGLETSPWLAGRTTQTTSLILSADPGETAQFAVRALHGQVAGPQTYLGQHTAPLDWFDGSAVSNHGMTPIDHPLGTAGRALSSTRSGSAFTVHQASAAQGLTVSAQVPSGEGRVEVRRGNRVVGGMRFRAGGPSVCTLPIQSSGDDIRVTVMDAERIEVTAVSLPRAGQTSTTPSTANPCDVTFTDNPYGSMYFEAVHWIQWAGISNGYAADNTYRTTSAISRGESLAFIHRFVAPEATGGSSGVFTDVPTTHTFFDAIAWAVDEGIAKGYADGTYRASQSVTRAEFASLFYRTVDNPAGAAPSTAFSDVSADSSHAEAIAWMKGQGLITGYSDGTFQPNRQISRGEVAVVMHRYALATGH